MNSFNENPGDPQVVDLILHSAAQLCTLWGGVQRGERLGELGLISDGALAIQEGLIAAAGSTEQILENYRSGHMLNASGQVVLPGFVDPHTHLVWAGDRAVEFEQRVAGASYLEIMQAGGGIVSTVRSTREAGLEEMVRASQARVERMLQHGTTTAEVKTGYGLELETELKMLQAILELDADSPLDLVPTFFGAHAIPPEFTAKGSGGAQAYTELVAGEMLPAVKAWWGEHAADRPLPYVDVFCEDGAFSLAQSRTILEAARALGFPLKIHADEFRGLGGTGLAVSLGAASADHLVQTPDEDIQALGGSDTVAVALPCTPFGLAEHEYTPAGAIIAAGGILAIATDLNPGTAWCENIQMAIALATRYMGITPAQAIAAATINAAAAIGRADRVGSLEAGKQADLILLDIPDYRHLGYRFGTNLVSTTMKRGQILEV
ncbi:MAG: imidazolonepropionase [Anaerolineales bacterium]|nr:imidazolonepropionase [Anaerolineales bacterium]